MIKSVQIVLFCIVSSFAYGQFNASPVLTDRDRILVQIDLDKGISYSHTIKAKQTLFSIAKFFKVPVQELRFHNDLTNQSVISIGQQINIPINGNQIIKTADRPAGSIPVLYQVKTKETLFRLAKVYFPQQIGDLVERNQLSDLSLDIHQMMVVGYFALNPDDRVMESEETGEYSRIDTISSIEEASTVSNIPAANFTRSKKGIAIWNKNGSDKKNAFVLHRDAKVNTFIELYNPVVGRRTMAKVVGKLPADYYQSDVIMIMSPKVAESLGALDSRLLVEMSYQDSTISN
jgi:hypothetical protein